MTADSKSVTARSGHTDFMRGTVLALLLTAVLASGCSVRTFALNKMGDALAESGSTFASDNDPELISEAAPFSLKLMESILAETPDHRELLLAVSQGFVQYSYAFVELPADEIESRDVKAAYAQRERARRLYIRARDYGLRGLKTEHPDLEKTLKKDPVGTLSRTTIDDVGLLYWTGVAWAAAISLSKDNPYLVSDLPIVAAMMQRALVLDESYNYGAIHVFLISYEMSRSSLRAGAPARARKHFERAVELSQGMQAAPFVTYAEAYAVAQRNQAEFKALLQRALKIDVNARPDFRLANLVMQRRARWLLGRTDELIPE